MLPCHVITVFDTAGLCWCYTEMLILLNNKFELIAPTYTAEKQLVGGNSPAPNSNKNKVKGTGTGM